MIESLRFVNGYPTRISGIKKRLFSFGSGLNLIIGPNGGGKTTILSTLANLTGCGRGGWSDASVRTDLPYEAEAVWDGIPVYYQDCHADSSVSFLNERFFDEHSFLRSTGEKRIGLINELINALEARFPTYKTKKDSRPTLLLDEVDNHVGFVGQSFFWKSVTPLLIKKYQVLVSTHSVFPLLFRKDTVLRQDVILELDRAYVEACLRELSEAVDHYNKAAALRKE